ncbi:MAG: hypothetical protein WCA52_02720 [Candidatus Aquilonibacter sp.]
MFRFLPYVGFSFVMALSCFAPIRSADGPPQVHVFSCQVISGTPYVPRTDDIGLVVRFKNESADDLASIVWRSTYGTFPVGFIDDGTFSPGVQIDNDLLFERGSTHFNWGAALGDAAAALAHTMPAQSLAASNMVLPQYFGTEDPGNCAIVRVTYSSGQIWENPELPQLLTPPPSPSATPPSPAPSPPPDPAVEPVTLGRCILNIDGKAYLQVTFRNESTKPADRIVVRADYESSALDFTDQGTFSQDSLISHTIKISPPDELSTRTYLGFNDPARCAVVSVHYTDGTSWQNSAIPATPGPLPTAIPSAIVLRTSVMKWTQRHSRPTPIPSGSPLPPATPAS